MSRLSAPWSAKAKLQPWRYVGMNRHRQPTLLGVLVQHQVDEREVQGLALLTEEERPPWDVDLPMTMPSPSPHGQPGHPGQAVPLSKFPVMQGRGRFHQ